MYRLITGTPHVLSRYEIGRAPVTPSCGLDIFSTSHVLTTA